MKQTNFRTLFNNTTPTELSNYVGNNLLINGDFSVWQRGTTFNNVSYCADRFFYNNSGATGTVTRVQSTRTDEPSSSEYHLKYDCTVGNNHTGIFCRQENPENYDGKELTFSFWYKLTGKPIAITDEFSNGTDYSDHRDIDTLEVSADWAKKVVTFTPTFTGTWVWDENRQYTISVRQSGTDMSTTPFVLELRDMKLEIGDVATQFVPDTPAENLAKCQRFYYEESIGVHGLSYKGLYSHAYDYRINVSFPVAMRAIPDLSGTTYQNPAFTNVSTAGIGTTGGIIFCNQPTGATGGIYINRLVADAEL